MISGREWLATGKHISLLKRAGNGTGFYSFSTMGRFLSFRFGNETGFSLSFIRTIGWLVRIDRHGKIHLPGQVVR